MTDSSGAIMRNMTQVLPEVDYLRIDVHDCSLNLGKSVEPGARLIADYSRRWELMEAQKAVSAVQVGVPSGKTSNACLLINQDAAFEDVNITVKGKSVLDGSLAAESIALSFKDGSMAAIDSISADSILVTAFGCSSVAIENARAKRILVIVEDESLVSVGNSVSDLILVRQHKQGQAKFKNASKFSDDAPDALFALTGSRDYLWLPPNPHIVPQEAVDEYWRSLEETTA